MTITASHTVGEIATQSVAAVRIFENKGIDYCCGGRQSLALACQQRGIDPNDLIAEIKTSEGETAPVVRNWQTASLAELIGHILVTHHNYLNSELPRLTARMATVLGAHRVAHGPLLQQLSVILAAMREELEVHMQKEETVLFPFVERLDEAAAAGHAPPHPSFGSVANPIRMMEHEHETVGRALEEMRRITSGFSPPPDACNTFRALYAGLEALERDLHQHIHLENNILFPRTLSMEQGRGR